MLSSLVKVQNFQNPELSELRSYYRRKSQIRKITQHLASYWSQRTYRIGIRWLLSRWIYGGDLGNSGGQSYAGISLHLVPQTILKLC